MNEAEELRAGPAGADDGREWYRELFELGPEPHIVTDTEGHILEGNRAAAELFASEPIPLTGKLLPTFVPLAARRALRRAMLAATRGPAPVLVAFPLSPRGGPATTVQARIVRYPRRESTRLSWLLGEVAAARRISDLELLDEAAQLGRERLEAIVRELPAAVLVVDAGTRTIVLANQRAHDLFVDGAGSAGSVLRDPELLDRGGAAIKPAARPLARLLATGQSTSAERFGHRRQDGSLVTLEVSAVPLLDAGGNVGAGILVAHDVTERDVRDRAEREFVANAAHQLRTPVAAIQSAIDVLEAGAKDDLQARDRFLGHIARSALRLGQLSHSLLVLAGAQSGERPRSELVEVAPLLREVAAQVRPAPEVEVQVRCRGDLAVLANRELLLEVLASFADNAVRYTRRGRIVLTARRNGRENVTIEVADSGTGMTPETQARIFERFYGDQGRGSFGLGLSIAAQAAEVMGAAIDVESQPGTGTRVRIKLQAGMLRAT